MGVPLRYGGRTLFPFSLAFRGMPVGRIAEGLSPTGEELSLLLNFGRVHSAWAGSRRLSPSECRSLAAAGLPGVTLTPGVDATEVRGYLASAADQA